jgi:hypothetical protein
MALTDIIKAAAQAEDIDAAHVLALQLNADLATRRLIYGKAEFSSMDVIRLGKTMLSYQAQGLPRVSELDDQVRATVAAAVTDAAAEAAE